MTVPFRTGMYGKVFGTSMQLIVSSVIGSLQTFHYHDTHATGEIRVFTVGLNTPSPTRITVNIHRRRPHGKSLITLITALRCVICIFCTRLIRYGIEYFIYCLRRKRGRHTYRLRKNRSQSGACHTVQRLVPPVIGFDTQALHRLGSVHHQCYFFFQSKFFQ